MNQKHVEFSASWGLPSWSHPVRRCGRLPWGLWAHWHAGLLWSRRPQRSWPSSPSWGARSSCWSPGQWRSKGIMSKLKREKVTQFHKTNKLVANNGGILELENYESFHSGQHCGPVLHFLHASRYSSQIQFCSVLMTRWFHESRGFIIYSHG